MKHYLNERLRGKQGPNKEKLLPVYLMFSVFGQTYQIKSKLIKQLLPKKKFKALEGTNSRAENILLTKDKEILSKSIEEAIIDSKFDFKKLKTLYQGYTITFTEWLNTFTSYVTEEVDKGNIDDPSNIWSLASEIKEDQYKPFARELLQLQSEHKVLISEPLLYLQSMVIEKRKEMDLLGLALIYDWEHGELKNQFQEYLKAKDISEKKRKTILLFLDNASTLVQAQH